MGRHKGSKTGVRIKIISHGYILVWNPEHREAMKKGYVREHRMVMSDYLKRKLKPKEQVHHINGKRNDNRIENLKLINIGEHVTYHHKGIKKPRKNSQICCYNNCERLTGSKYGLCTKHYKAQWQRKNNGLIKNLNLLTT